MAGPATATLLISCPDQVGLVAAVSGFIGAHGGNILHADQHADPETSTFFQRVEFELDGVDLDRDELRMAFAVVAAPFRMRWQLRFSDDVARLAILVSHQPHCLYDLLARWRAGELAAEVPLVISNHGDLAAVAEHFGVAFHNLPVTPETKTEQEAAIRELLTRHNVSLIVLARYMQILSDEFVTAYADRVINIHHSFLPAFVGVRPYQQAYERGVKIVGVTAHYATAALDDGPIIDQDVVRVSHRDSVVDVVRKGADLEKAVLARAVRAHLEHRILVYGTKTVVFP